MSNSCFSIAGRNGFSFRLKREFKLEKSVSKEPGDWDGVLFTAFLKDRSQPRLQALFLTLPVGEGELGTAVTEGGRCC